MSLEAINTISAAEEHAKLEKQKAVAATKKMIAEAEEKGKTIVEDSKERAASELEEQKKIEMDKARQEAVELASTTENRKAAMLVKAETRTDKAINIVVERIVNG